MPLLILTVFFPPIPVRLPWGSFGGVRPQRLILFYLLCRTYEKLCFVGSLDLVKMGSSSYPIMRRIVLVVCLV